MKENKYTNKETCTELKKKKKQIVSKNVELFHQWNWLMQKLICKKKNNSLSICQA